MLEIRDTSWYKAKAKEIKDIRRENLWSVMDIVAKVAQRVVIESNPKPRFKDGAKVNTGIEGVVLRGEEGLFRPAKKRDMVTENYIAAVKRRKGN